MAMDEASTGWTSHYQSTSLTWYVSCSRGMYLMITKKTCSHFPKILLSSASKIDVLLLFSISIPIFQYIACFYSFTKNTKSSLFSVFSRVCHEVFVLRIQ